MENPFPVVIGGITLHTELIRQRGKAVVRFAAPLAAQIDHATPRNRLIHHPTTNPGFRFQKQHAASLLFDRTCCDQTRQPATNHHNVNGGT